MNKKINVYLLVFLTILFLSVTVFADGKVEKITEEQAIKIIGFKSLWTEKQFAKKAGISVEKLKEVKENFDEPVNNM